MAKDSVTCFSVVKVICNHRALIDSFLLMDSHQPAFPRNASFYLYTIRKVGKKPWSYQNQMGFSPLTCMGAGFHPFCISNMLNWPHCNSWMFCCWQVCSRLMSRSKLGPFGPKIFLWASSYPALTLFIWLRPFSSGPPPPPWILASWVSAPK